MTDKIFAIGILLLGLAGCGSDTPASKDLFTVWARQTPTTGGILDFTGMSFGANSLQLSLSSPYDVVCTCALAISGTQDGGQYVISACSKNSGTGTEADCDNLESSGTFGKTTDTLTLCRTSNGVCTTWK